MFCKNCGKELAENAGFCVECGAPKGSGSTFCPKCGTAVNSGSAFCANCGATLAAVDETGTVVPAATGAAASVVPVVVPPEPEQEQPVYQEPLQAEQQNYNPNYGQGYAQGPGQQPPYGNGYNQGPGAAYTGYNPNPGLPPGYEQKSKLAAGLMGIFLGALGVHNFYLGKKKYAIIQLLLTLLTCGMGAAISGTWGLIEGIMILTGSINKDGNGYPLKE